WSRPSNTGLSMASRSVIYTSMREPKNSEPDTEAMALIRMHTNTSRNRNPYPRLTYCIRRRIVRERFTGGFCLISGFIFAASFGLGFINLAVNFAGLEQFLMGTHGGNLAAVHHQNFVGVLNGGDTLGNDELGGVGDLLPERLAD